MKVKVDLRLGEEVEINLLDGYVLEVKRHVNGLTSEVVDAIHLRDAAGAVVAYNRIAVVVSEAELERICGGIPK